MHILQAEIKCHLLQGPFPIFRLWPSSPPPHHSFLLLSLELWRSVKRFSSWSYKYSLAQTENVFFNISIFFSVRVLKYDNLLEKSTVWLRGRGIHCLITHPGNQKSFHLVSQPIMFSHHCWLHLSNTAKLFGCSKKSFCNVFFFQLEKFF